MNAFDEAAPGAVAEPSGSADDGRRGADSTPLRLLWVKVGGLWPLNTGGRLRSFHTIRELCEAHELTVVTTHAPGQDPEELVRRLPGCRRVRSVPYRPAKKNSARFLLALLRSWMTPLPAVLFKSRVKDLHAAVAETLEDGDFDLIIADFLFAVPNVRLGGDTPVLFFSHNVEYMIWRRLEATETRWLRKRLLAHEWKKMRRYELEACRKADFTVAVSEEDRDQLARGSGRDNIRAIATGVDLEYFQVGDRRDEAPRELVFCGSMDWHPNEDAMRYFMETMLPRLREALSDVTVTVVGRNPSDALRAAADRHSVRVTGTVPDVRPFVQRAAVYIVPLRVGGGTRLKIYEALAMGKAVVSTHIGAEGLPLEEGKHILRADEPDEFVRHVLSLLNDPARRAALGNAGRSLMEERFSWSRVAAEFADHCREAIR